MIEKNIFQIYHDINLIPEYVKKNLIKLNQNYTYNIFDFNKGKEIILQNFDQDLSNKICHTLDILPRYCHKSDLLRYCLLYIYGGVYLDCDLQAIKSFDDFIENDLTLMTTFGIGEYFGTFEIDFNNNKKTMYKIMANGFFAATKNNPLLLELIYFCINNPINQDPMNRGINVVYLYNFLIKKINLNNIVPFKKYIIENNIIYLILQDEYKKNNFINLNNEVLIKTDNENYNFNRQSSGII